VETGASQGPRRAWLDYLLAIILGNAIYFLVIEPVLPEPLRHQPFRLDWGLALDFLVCVAVYALVRLVRKPKG